jgi:hypothetical protein
MTDALSKIWNTTFTDHTINLRRINYRIPNETLDRRVEGSRGFKYPDGKPLPPDLVPEYLFFAYPDDVFAKYKDPTKDYKSNTPDLVMITNGLLVISEKLRDLLVGFDMGTTLIHEVPLYENDQKTRRPGRWFILHITANKKTVIPELSENVKQIGETGHWYSPVAQLDVLAVHAESAKGADLWIDPHYGGRIFLSDRLKSALKPAGIRVLKLPLRPCTVIAGDQA